MPGELSSYQKWEPVTLHRSELQNAPYNPRVLPAKARAKLKKNLARVGLLEPPVWNRRTGNIVGGHQRLSILDSLHKSADYSLTVAAVELSEKEEREQNLFLNNGEAQGEWDLEKLEAMFQDGLDVDATGFDPANVIRMFGVMPGQGEGRTPDQLEDVAAAVDAAKKARKAIDSKAGDPFSVDHDYYLVLVGGNNAQREAVTNALGLDDNRYQDVRVWGRLIGLAESLGASPVDLIEWAAGEHDDRCRPELMSPVAAAHAAPVGGKE